jgi:pSer/pThr/pTyr-binding forkhead associated (FHA) protein
MAKEVEPLGEVVAPGKGIQAPPPASTNQRPAPGGGSSKAALQPGGKAPPAASKAPPAPAAPAKAKTLYILNSQGDMHKIDKDTFIIGRSRTCDLVISSSKVSRQHSSVVRENGEFYIEDLGSANGVWRDGVKIQKEKVRDNDEFMISEEVLKFVFR